MVRDESKLTGLGLNRFARMAKLLALRRLVRPIYHIRESETISFAEKQADLQLARFTRQILARTGVPSQTACTSFGQMHYYDSAPGSGQVPLVLLHGIGSSGQCYALLSEFLKHKRRVVLPDLFHFSGFSRPNNPVMTLAEHCQSVFELLAEINCAECDFVGLSLGGWIGQKLAVSKPNLVRRLMLLNSAGLRFASITLRDRLTYLSWENFQAFYPGIMYAPPYRNVRFVSPIVKRSLYRLLKDHAVKDFLRTLRPGDFMEPTLQQISCPVLLLWGDRDTFLSNQFPHHYMKHIPNIRGYFVEDCAHILCLESPVNVLEHMCSFFKISIDFRQPALRALGMVLPRHDEREIGTSK